MRILCATRYLLRTDLIGMRIRPQACMLAIVELRYVIGSTFRDFRAPIAA